MSKYFRPSLLMIALSAAFPGVLWAAPAGRVDFAVGGVKAVAADGRQRVLSKGQEINAGDTIDTGEGRAQIRFADGAYTSLQPRTQFRIDKFNFSGASDGSEKGVFSLIKGGLRTITGLIGRVNKQNYELQTATATIGIRGTEFSAQADGPLKVSVGGGSITVTNDAGTFLVNNGQSAVIADRHAPVVISSPPVLPPRNRNDDFRPMQQKQDIRQEDVITSQPTSDGGLPFFIPSQAIVVGGLGAFAIDSDQLHLVLNRAKFSAQGQAVDFSNDDGLHVVPVTAKVLESTFDGSIGVGRWTSGLIKASVPNASGALIDTFYNLSDTQGLHYVFGVPPTGSLPPAGLLRYNMMAATHPTAFDGSLGLGKLLAAGLSIDLLSGRVGVAFDVLFPNVGYKVSTTGGLDNPKLSEVFLIPKAAGVFAGVALPTAHLDGSSAGCSVCPQTDILGFLSGQNGSRAGYTYRIHDNNLALFSTQDPSERFVDGAVAFRSDAPPGNQLVGNTVLGGIALSHDKGILPGPTVSASDAMVDVGVQVSVAANGALVKFSESSSGGSVTIGNLAAAEVGFDDLIVWGRWTPVASGNGTTGGGGGAQHANLTLTSPASLHYVAGLPTAAGPVPSAGVTGIPGTMNYLKFYNFTATYGLTGATSPTSSGANSNVGSVTNAALQVNFGTSSVNFGATLAIGGYNYAVSAPSMTINVSQATFAGTGVASGGICATAAAQVSGFFAGANAIRAGVAYNIDDTGTLINGAMAFAQKSLAGTAASNVVLR